MTQDMAALVEAQGHPPIAGDRCAACGCSSEEATFSPCYATRGSVASQIMNAVRVVAPDTTQSRTPRLRLVGRDERDDGFTDGGGI